MIVGNNGADPEWGTLTAAEISDFITYQVENDPCVKTPSYVYRFLAH